jgi:hypothetical protein
VTAIYTRACARRTGAHKPASFRKQAPRAQRPPREGVGASAISRARARGGSPRPWTPGPAQTEADGTDDLRSLVVNNQAPEGAAVAVALIPLSQVARLYAICYNAFRSMSSLRRLERMPFLTKSSVRACACWRVFVRTAKRR